MSSTVRTRAVAYPRPCFAGVVPSPSISYISSRRSGRPNAASIIFSNFTLYSLKRYKPCVRSASALWGRGPKDRTSGRHLLGFFGLQRAEHLLDRLHDAEGRSVVRGGTAGKRSTSSTWDSRKKVLTIVEMRLPHRRRAIDAGVSLLPSWNRF